MTLPYLADRRLGNGRRALVIGASGHIGRAVAAALSREGWMVVRTALSRKDAGYSVLDVTCRNAVLEFVDALEPDVVCLAAGLSDPDKCEVDEARALMVNISGTSNVVDAASRAGATVVFFSSAYVFDGKAGPYEEDAPVAPLSVYGHCKVGAEAIIRAAPIDHLIIRTTVVYGWDLSAVNGFGMKIWHALSSGRKVVVASDQLDNASHVRFLADATIELLRHGIRGVVHVAGEEITSRAALACRIAEALDLDPSLIVERRSSSLCQVAKRPLRGGLLTGRLERTIGRKPRRLEDGIALLRSEWKLCDVLKRARDELS
jgi:dTDP-4-dehydrorhamnose reductase